MSTSEATTYEQYPISLSYKDKELEKEYRLSYEKEIRKPLRFGIIISILSWLSGLSLVYYVIPERLYELSVLTVIVICPFFLFIVFATYNERLKGWIHIIGALSNAWAGLYAVYFCNQFPEGHSFTLPVLIFIIFFGSYMVRLRWVAGFLAALSYTAGFHFYMLYYTDLDYSLVSLFAFVAWLTLVFTMLAGHLAENNSRVRFMQKRTIAAQNELIAKEKEASEKLLLNVIPPFIASRLKEEKGVIADIHKDASVMFADIVGFTKLSASLTADELLNLLNKIFSHFDMLTETYELEKIKTIGDGYMVAGGLTKNKIEHLHRITKMSLDMIDFIGKDEEMQRHDLKIRIGINSGSVIAGVIGINKFSYDLWGDTVNIASRMESNGETGKICVSEVVKLRLENHFEFGKRDLIEIKGKGPTQTYFLLGDKIF
ncbi:MAG: adenylate/guanylate cyclase domain-containing protein [Crocinitomicaceae bacterium]|nr:adenylate/guanylate cyclase domain-containing protein [Crocinitomicaceae bacterium]